MKCKAEELLITLTKLLEVANGLKNYYYFKNEMEMPFKFPDIFEENGRNINLMNLDRLQFDDPFIYDRNLKLALNSKMTDKATLRQLCTTCLLWYKHLLDASNATHYIPILKILLAEHLLTKYSHEAIGYWMRKLEELRKNEKSNNTNKERQAIKGKEVRKAWIRLIKDKKEKFAILSKNKIAKEIYDYVFPLLKNKKTKTSKYVLTRTKRLDKDGKLIIIGLSIDIIIMIMKKQKDLDFNPFIKKIA